MSQRNALHAASQTRIGLFAVVVLTSGALVAGASQSAAAPRPARVTTVTIDAADAYLPSNEGSYWVVTSPTVQLPLVLDQAAIGDGLSVSTVSSLSPPLGAVLFPPGATARTATRTFGDEAPVQFYPGWIGRWGYFSLTGAAPNAAVGTPGTLYIAWVSQTGVSAKGDVCAWEFYGALLCALQIPGFCPEQGRSRQGAAQGPGSDPPTVTLQRYRDEVLSSTTSGQYYIALYDQLGGSAVQAIVAAPSLAIRILKAQDDWIAALSALVNGSGGAATVSQSMQDNLLDILQTLQDAGSPGLASTLAFERERLNLDTITGLTMTQFQTQIVTLGGPTAVQQRSWGSVKDLYRPQR